MLGRQQEPEADWTDASRIEEMTRQGVTRRTTQLQGKCLIEWEGFACFSTDHDYLVQEAGFAHFALLDLSQPNQSGCH